jgi:hypothetical protein
MKSCLVPGSSLFPSLALSALLAVPNASAAVIYQHTFDGKSADTLNGVALDTANGAMGGSAGAGWTAHSLRYFSDGAITSTANGASAYVPFVPVSGNHYTITLSVDITSAPSTNWVALSLFNGTPNTGLSFHNVDTGSAGTTYATIGRRNSTASDTSGTDLLRWQGPRNNGINSHIDEPKLGVWDISILLDTTNPANWTFQWLMEGGDDTRHLSESYSLPTTTFSHIMISNNAGVSAKLHEFSVDVVPEPSIALISTLGTCLLGLRRSRSLAPR